MWFLIKQLEYNRTSTKNMKEVQMTFDFDKEIKSINSTLKVYSNTLKKIYNPQKKKVRTCRTETDETNKPAVYALYESNELKKIGKAVDGGVCKRMMQYYNGYKTGGLSKITNNNRDNINVRYVNLSSAEDCWIMERRLQVIAYDQGEKMPWEIKTRN